jgi:hypothetical protein
VNDEKTLAPLALRILYYNSLSSGSVTASMSLCASEHGPGAI